MARQAEIFDPTAYSIEEATYLLHALGQSPEVIEIDLASGTPAGVNAKAVLSACDRIHRLMQQAEHRGLQWCGVDAVRDALQTYITEFTKWQRDAQRGAPKYPSQYVWDDRGRGHKGAVGADAGTVATYFDADGNRHPFALELIGQGQTTFVPAWIKATPAPMVAALIEDTDKGTIQCPICYFTQSYDKDVRSTYNLARGRMQKHLTSARKHADKHREVFTQEFGQPNVQTAGAR